MEGTKMTDAKSIGWSAVVLGVLGVLGTAFAWGTTPAYVTSILVLIVGIWALTQK